MVTERFPSYPSSGDESDDPLDLIERAPQPVPAPRPKPRASVPPPRPSAYAGAKRRKLSKDSGEDSAVSASGSSAASRSPTPMKRAAALASSSDVEADARVSPVKPRFSRRIVSDDETEPAQGSEDDDAGGPAEVAENSERGEIGHQETPASRMSPTDDRSSSPAGVDPDIWQEDGAVHPEAYGTSGDTARREVQGDGDISEATPLEAEPTFANVELQVTAHEGPPSHPGEETGEVSAEEAQVDLGPSGDVEMDEGEEATASELAAEREIPTEIASEAPEESLHHVAQSPAVGQEISGTGEAGMSAVEEPAEVISVSEETAESGRPPAEDSGVSTVSVESESKAVAHVTLDDGPEKVLIAGEIGLVDQSGSGEPAGDETATPDAATQVEETEVHIGNAHVLTEQTACDVEMEDPAAARPFDARSVDPIPLFDSSLAPSTPVPIAPSTMSKPTVAAPAVVEEIVDAYTATGMPIIGYTGSGRPILGKTAPARPVAAPSSAPTAVSTTSAPNSSSGSSLTAKEREKARKAKVAAQAKEKEALRLLAVAEKERTRERELEEQKEAERERREAEKREKERIKEAEKREREAEKTAKEAAKEAKERDKESKGKSKSSKKGKVEDLKGKARSNSVGTPSAKGSSPDIYSSSASTPEPVKPSSSKHKGHGDRGSSMRGSSVIQPPQDESPEDDSEDDEVYCSCGQLSRADGNDDLVGCDACDHWYHAGCVGLKLEDLDRIDMFICQSCEKLTRQRTTFQKACARPACEVMFAGRQSKYCSSACGIKSARELLLSVPAKAVPELAAALADFPSPPPEVKVIDHAAYPDPPTHSANGLDMMPLDPAALTPRTAASILDALQAQLDAIKAQLDTTAKRQRILAALLDRCDTLPSINPSAAGPAVEENKKKDKKSSKSKSKSGGGSSAADDRPCGWSEAMLWEDEQVDDWDGAMPPLPPPPGGAAEDVNMDSEDEERSAAREIERLKAEMGDWRWCERPRKRCDRHNGWQKNASASLDREAEELTARMTLIEAQLAESREAQAAEQRGKSAR